MVKAGIDPKVIIDEYANGLKRKLKINKIIIFGSAAKYGLRGNSDLDIIVLSDNFRRINFIRRLELLSRARKGLCREVSMDIIGYTPEEFKELSKESAVLNEAKKNGKVIWP